MAMNRAANFALSLIVFVAFFDTFALLPVLSPYVQSLGASGWLLGWIVGIYSLTNLLANFGSGYLIDTFGRKQPMVWSLMLAAGLMALYGLVHSPFALLTVRALHGLTGAVFIPAMFTLVCEHRSDNRARAMGRVGAVIGLVALIAPPFAGLIDKYYGSPALFFTIAGMMAIACIVAGFSLQDRFTSPPDTLKVRPQIVLRLPVLQATYLATFAMTFAMGILTVRLPLLLHEAGFDAAFRGRVFGLFALAAIIVMMVARGRSPFKRAYYGVGLIALSSALIELLPMPGGTMGAMVTYGIGFGLTFPAVHLLAFEKAPAYARGTALALLHSFYSLGYVLAPPLGDAVPFSGYVGAGIAALCLIAAWLIPKRRAESVSLQAEAIPQDGFHLQRLESESGQADFAAPENHLGQSRRG
jgi:MFS family permease